MIHMRSFTALLSGLAVAAAMMACDRQPSATPEAGSAATAPGSQEMAETAAVADGEKAVTFDARGNEPFWSVKVDGASLVYATPENQPGLQLGATRTDTATDVEFRGSDGDKDFVLIITPGRCDDTMSDETFDYSATFSYGDRQLTGCASSGD